MGVVTLVKCNDDWSNELYYKCILVNDLQSIIELKIFFSTYMMITKDQWDIGKGIECQL